MRIQISTKLINELINAIDKIGETCEITRSNYLEITSTLYILANDLYSFTDDDLNQIIASLITKSSCSIRKKFKELHQKLSLDVKKEIVRFFYEVNLIENINYSCVKQANFYKGSEYLFYYAILDMKNTDINVYIEGLELPVEVVGINNAQSSEYVYLGRRRYFNRSDQESNKFNEICRKLGVPVCDIIKIHYKQLEKLTNVLKCI